MKTKPNPTHKKHNRATKLLSPAMLLWFLSKPLLSKSYFQNQTSRDDRPCSKLKQLAGGWKVYGTLPPITGW